MSWLPNLLNMFKGKAGGATMKPYQDLKAEELAAWEGYDPTNEKSRHTQYANAALAQQKKPMMFGQGGDPNKNMGDIWQQLKGTGKKIGEGLEKFGSDWESNYQKQMGYDDPVTPNPYLQEAKPDGTKVDMEEMPVEDLFKPPSNEPPADEEAASSGGMTAADLEKMGLKADEQGNYYPSNNSKSSEMMYKLDPKTGSYVMAPNYGAAAGVISQTPIPSMPITSAFDMGFGALDASGGKIK